MSKKSALLAMMALGAMHAPKDTPTQIKSYKIEQKRPKEQLSKRKLQKLKGKKNRKNRGKNRRKNDQTMQSKSP